VFPWGRGGGGGGRKGGKAEGQAAQAELQTGMVQEGWGELLEREREREREDLPCWGTPDGIIAGAAVCSGTAPKACCCGCCCMTWPCGAFAWG